MRRPLFDSSSLPTTVLLVVGVVLGLVGAAAGQTPRNVSIDDQDARITYTPSRATSPSWILTEPGEWDAGEGRAHMLTDDPAGVATFTFTGVAFYYWAAMWPYPVLSTVSVDGQATLVNLTDPTPPPNAGLPPSRRSSIVFSATNLANTSHTVRVTVGPGGNFAIVDLFEYTSVDFVPPTDTSSSDTATPTRTGDASNTDPANAGDGRSDTKGLSTAVKVGIAVAVVGLFLLLLVLILILRWLKKKKQQQPEKSMVVGYPSQDGAHDYSSTGSAMRLARSPTPTNPIWTDPDYVEANRRMNLPVPQPYQQLYTGSQSSVRLVPPTAFDPDDPRRFSDGSNYPSSISPPLSVSPTPGSQPVPHIPYHPYAQSTPFNYNSRNT